MKTPLITATLLLATVTVSACAKQGYESQPVVVPTNYGNVTCQLYTKDTVWWDESISHPNTMSEKVADDVCVQTGHKWANDGKTVQGVTTGHSGQVGQVTTSSKMSMAEQIATQPQGGI